jgi:hypothetical protein
MSELFQTRATLNIVARALFDQEELENVDPRIYGDFALVVEACSRMVLNTITSLDELDSTPDMQRGRK